MQTVFAPLYVRRVLPSFDRISFKGRTVWGVNYINPKVARASTDVLSWLEPII